MEPLNIVEIDGLDQVHTMSFPLLGRIPGDHSIPPVGSVPRVWKEGKKLMASVRWDMADPFAAELERKYRDEFLKGVPVGFKPLEFDHLDTGGIRFTKQELLEISAVAVPMHPDALMKGLAGLTRTPSDPSVWADILNSEAYRKHSLEKAIQTIRETAEIVRAARRRSLDRALDVINIRTRRRE